MSVRPSQLDRLEALLLNGMPEELEMEQIRRELPGLSLTRCDSRDVDGEEPFRRFARISVYLVDGSEHCWRLTEHPEQATGIVLALDPRG